MKKITLATIKSFIKKNKDNLYISRQSVFDGRVDCVTESKDQDFHQALCLTQGMTDTDVRYRLGVSGAWFVRGSHNYFTAWEDADWFGYEVSNCCGCFILAIPQLAK